MSSRQRSSGGGWFSRLLAVALLLAVGFGFLYLQYLAPASNRTEEVIFEIPPGANLRQVARLLSERGLIRSPWSIKIIARLSGEKVRLGEYLLRANMSPFEILRILASGKSILHPLTIVEGLNIYEIAALVEAKGLGSAKEFLNLCRDSKLIQALLGEKRPSLEGYLFPETYGFTKFTTPEVIIRTAVQRFLTVYSSLEGIQGKSRHATIILASIIEKETGAPEERPLISSVFHNRLRRGMKLQTDPTVLYGMLVKTGIASLNIRRQNLTEPSDYNTYLLPALPAGPISNPGRESLQAALRPANSPYLYFVSRNNGTHIFSENYKDHVAAVQKFQLDSKAREGRSWRDLKQRKGVN